MKAIILTLYALCIMCSCLRAQIVLSGTDYPATLTGTDTLKVTAFNSLFPPLLSGPAAVWDLSIVTDSVPEFYGYRVPVGGYHYADSGITFNLGSYTYIANAICQLSTAGLFELKFEVLSHAFDLAPITAGSFDTLYILAQTASHTNPEARIGLPATYGARWQSYYRTDVNYELSIAFFSLWHTPGTRRTYTERKDTVTGWGKMRVKNASGLPSAYLDVLQVQTTIVTTDSFFLNGSPAPAVVLAALSITQGHKDTTWTQDYYRKHEVRPLAHVEYRDAAFLQPYRATVHRQRLVVGVPHLAGTDAIAVYPNPATSQLSFLLPAKISACSYALVDMAGRTLMSGTTTLAAGAGTLQLMPQIPPGAYCLHLWNEEGLNCTRAITIGN